MGEGDNRRVFARQERGFVSIIYPLDELYKEKMGGIVSFAKQANADIEQVVKIE
jgi:hypothetical protein